MCARSMFCLCSDCEWGGHVGLVQFAVNGETICPGDEVFGFPKSINDVAESSFEGFPSEAKQQADIKGFWFLRGCAGVLSTNLSGHPRVLFDG